GLAQEEVVAHAVHVHGHALAAGAEPQQRDHRAVGEARVRAGVLGALDDVVHVEALEARAHGPLGGPVPRGDAPRPEGLPAEDGPRGAAAVDRGLARERAHVHAALVRGVQAPRRDELELAQARHVAAL
ncbi:hypothetical protein DC025_14360, partial [Enterococcus faecalis]